VSDFSGLGGVDSLKYLAIHGTLDWRQPIGDFKFLRGLGKLEVLALWQFINKAAYPALLPALALKKLKKLRLHGGYLATEEYALLEEGLQRVDGTAWGPYRTRAHSQLKLPRNDLRSRLPEAVIRSKHPEVTLCYDGRRTIDDPASRWFEFTGKGAGRVKCDSKTAQARCQKYAAQYAAMRARARKAISKSA
jgi:hypothetical protein